MVTRTGFLSGAATCRGPGRAVTSAMHVPMLLNLLLEVSLDGGLLLIIKLTVLVGVEPFQEFLLELGLAGFMRLADSLLFLLIDLTVLIGIKFLHKGGMRTWSLSTVATR